MPLALRPVNKNGVILKVEGTTVTFAGSIDSPRPENFMGPFIRELNRSIISNNILSINLDITKLSFLNSAGIREIVDWILMIKSLPPEQRYSINIIYSSRYLWQESSTSTFVFLNTDFITKEEV